VDSPGSEYALVADSCEHGDESSRSGPTQLATNCPDDGGSKHIWNNSHLLRDYMTQTQKLEVVILPPRESRISLIYEMAQQPSVKFSVVKFRLHRFICSQAGFMRRWLSSGLLRRVNWCRLNSKVNLYQYTTQMRSIFVITADRTSNPTQFRAYRQTKKL
jgi:hypothetical protein